MSLIDRPEPLRRPRQPPTGPKPVLPMVQLPIFRVKARHLEDYLYEVYRMGEFDFLLAAGLKAGECPEYIVQAALPAAHEGPRRANEIRSGRRTKNVALILNVLCLDGYIPAGKYIIDTHREARPIDVYTSLMKTRLDVLDPDCVAFKNAHRKNKTFMAQAAVVDKMVEEAVAVERELLGK
jgi:hypothetical protein